MIRKLLAASFLFLGVQAMASANVVYTWVTTASSKDLLPLNPQISLVFTDEVVASGSIQAQFGPAYPISANPGLYELHYRAGPNAFIDYSPTQAFPTTGGMIRASITFLPGGVLGGSLVANSGYADFAMSSNGPLFTFDRVAADDGSGSGCASDRQDCRGATGYFYESFRYTVPEPGSLALIGIGLLGAFKTTRRRKV